MVSKIPLTLEGVANFIKSDACSSIVVLTGAGCSVAAGIPDFRSAGGMYDTLKPDLITATAAQRELLKQDPTFVVEKGLFRENQFPYLEVRRPFILGSQEKKWKPTIAHRFLELLHLNGKLSRLFTQNIDGLDYQCKIPHDKIIPVHGTMMKIGCEECGAEMDLDDFCSQVKTNVKDIYNMDESAPKRSKNIFCKSCGAPAVKPTTVLFGGSLPEEFFDCKAKDLKKPDLVIVIGTSLVVGPANSIAYDIPNDCIRLIINNEPVGQEFGIVYGTGAIRDVFGKGQSDAVCLELVNHLGWLDQLMSVKDELPEASQKTLEAFNPAVTSGRPKRSKKE